MNLSTLDFNSELCPNNALRTHSKRHLGPDPGPRPDRRGHGQGQGIVGAAEAKYTGTVNAANTRLQGTQALASGIGSAGQSLGRRDRQAGQIFSQNKLKANVNLGKMDAYQQLGLMSPEQADQISGLNNQDKIAGALAVFDSYYSQQLQTAQRPAAEEGPKKINQAYDRTGQVIEARTPSGEAVPMVRTSDAQAQILQPAKPTPPRILASRAATRRST